METSVFQANTLHLAIKPYAYALRMQRARRRCALQMFARCLRWPCDAVDEAQCRVAVRNGVNPGQSPQRLFRLMLRGFTCQLENTIMKAASSA